MCNMLKLTLKVVKKIVVNTCIEGAYLYFIKSCLFRVLRLLSIYYQKYESPISHFISSELIYKTTDVFLYAGHCLILLCFRM